MKHLNRDADLLEENKEKKPSVKKEKTQGSIGQTQQNSTISNSGRKLKFCSSKVVKMALDRSIL